MSDQTGLRGRHDLLERLAPGGAEDFITETFCWILQQEEVGNAFLEFIVEQAERTHSDTIPRIVYGIQNGNCRWSTQVSSGGKRLDMTCANEKKQALIFEHKTWTKLHHNQLEDYRWVGKRDYGEFAIVLITARHYQKEQNPDLHLLWRDVYSWLDKWLGCWLSKRLPEDAPGTGADKANLDFVCNNFLTLLRKQGLGPMTPIKREHFEAFEHVPNANKGMRILWDMLEAARHRWSQNMQDVLKVHLEMLEPSKLQGKSGRGQWGRIGFNLLEGWHPGVFIGVLYDGTDHRVTLLGGKNSPDACAILDVDTGKYRDYSESCHYGELVGRLQKQWPADGSAWQAIHHLNAPSPNRWHPIHIRRNLADVLLDGKSGEEQVDLFLEAVKEVVKFIDGLDEFWNLRKELQEGQDNANGE